MLYEVITDSNFEHGMHEKDFTKVIEKPTWVTRCALIEKERLVGAFSNCGFMELSSMSFYNRRLRLNLTCKEGSLVLRYLVSGREVARHVITSYSIHYTKLYEFVQGDHTRVIGKDLQPQGIQLQQIKAYM